MTVIPTVLGLREEEALARFNAAGLDHIDICVSGRRREGVARVIRQKEAGDRVELVVSYFKELEVKSPLSPAGDIPPS